MRLVVTTALFLLMGNLAFAPPIDRTRPIKEQLPKPGHAQFPPASTPEEAEQAYLHLMEEFAKRPQFADDPNKQAALDDAVMEDLAMMAQAAVKLKSQAITDALVAFPAQSPGATHAKARAFRTFADPVSTQPVSIEGAVPFLVRCLSHPAKEIQEEASDVLVVWGREWDLAVQTIYNNNNYLHLQYSKDPRAADVCRFGALNGSYEGRILAAYALQAFGDSTTLVEVSRFVIENAPIDDGQDYSLARAKHAAIQTLVEHHQLDNIAALSRLTMDNSSLVRMKSVDAIAIVAATGSVEAFDALRRVADSNPDQKLRGSARLLLERLSKIPAERK